MDGAQPGASARTCARPAGVRAAEAFLDCRALAGSGRGRRRGAGRLPRSRVDSDRARARERLAPEIFELPVERIRDGFYTDAYFNHARATLLADGVHPRVLMQVFQRKHAVLGGMDEAIAILKLCSHGWDGLEVHALYDGDDVEPWETVLTIEGDYTLFAHLETVYLGVLARRTLVTTNVRRVVEAANGKSVLYFPARHDHFAMQPGDGLAARIGGVDGVSTDAQASLWGGLGIGTIPHALIAAYGGDTVRAADRVRRMGSAGDEHRRPRRLRERLGANCGRGRASARPAPVGRATRHVGRPRRPDARRLSTIRPCAASTSSSCAQSARRSTARGYDGVRIVVSGGFDVERIRAFEERGVPVDAYGVGSSLIRGENDFTADVVVTDGRAVCEGRSAPASEPASRTGQLIRGKSTRTTPRRPATMSSSAWCRRVLRAAGSRRDRTTPLSDLAGVRSHRRAVRDHAANERRGEAVLEAVHADDVIDGHSDASLLERLADDGVEWGSRPARVHHPGGCIAAGRSSP